MKILIVEDDERLSEVIQKALINQHYLVELAPDGQLGLELAQAFEYDLILLDLNLPKLDGISVCRQLRQGGDRTPILLLTAQDSSTKKVTGLDAGADDYIVKPFDLPELLARIRAWLRRGSATLVNLEWGKLRLVPSHCQVTYDGQLLSLTAKEYALLELLLRHPHRIFSQSDLLSRLWSYDKTPSENAVRTHVKSLRQKLKQAGAVELIETVYGLGYRLKEPSASCSNSCGDAAGGSQFRPLKAPSKTALNSLPTLEAREQEPQETNQQTLSKLSSIVWKQYQPQYLKRLDVIEQAVAALRSGQLSDRLRQQAIREAHTLAGSLGIFGLSEASQLSRQSEQLLRLKTQEKLEPLSELMVRLRQNINSGEAPPSVPDLEREQGSLTSPLPPVVKPKLLIVDDDAALTGALALAAGSTQVEVAPTLAQARESILHHRPDVVLLELYPHSGENGFKLLEELTTAQPPIPVVVLTAQDSFSNRVKVARLGGQSFIGKPANPSEVMSTVALHQQWSSPTAKLLIVDDDPQILNLLSSILQPWGFDLVLLDNPQRFGEVLEESQPDLLILDVTMPEVSGIELCQVVRNDPHWQELPVLFLSTYRDSPTIQKVFEAGADDYISKPIVEPELVARILNRLKREHYRCRAQNVTLTTNPGEAIRQLERLLSLAKRQNKPCCLALLKLDRKIGDRVLRSLEDLLAQSFRHEDVICRWQGPELLIGLYNATRSASVKRLTDLECFAQQRFTDQEGQTSVTFSVGVAEYPRQGTNLETLYQAAEIALHFNKLQ